MSDLDEDFRLTSRPPAVNQSVAFSPSNSRSRQSIPMDTVNDSESLEKQTRPSTPTGLTKKEAKRWRKNWDYQERQRLKALRLKLANNKTNNNNTSSPILKDNSTTNRSSRSKMARTGSLKSNKSTKSNASSQQKTTQRRHVLPQYDNPHTKKKSKKQALVQRIPIDKEKQISLFAHLPQTEKYLFYISPKVTTMIHPVILRAGLYFNDGTSWGANTRCITMLNALRTVVEDFKCPSTKSFARELLVHLNPCIQFLNDCRPQSVSMGNTIRWLKSKISQIASESEGGIVQDEALTFSDDAELEDVDDAIIDVEDDDIMDTDSEIASDEVVEMDGADGSSGNVGNVLGAEYNEEDQKKKIIDAITEYVLRIETADKMISVELIDRIKDDDVLLTFARSYVVEKSLIRAFNEGKRFKVVVVDARPHHEGKLLLHALSTNCPAMDISYTLINSASYVMSKEVNKVILGAACIMSNGSVVSRSGTATIALVAAHYKIPVIVCCETYKFSERVQIDSICSNELGDFDALIRNGKDKASNKDKGYLGSLFSRDKHAAFESKLNLDLDAKDKKDDDEEEEDDTESGDSTPFRNKLLGNWRSMPKLKMCNLKYDTTPSKLIKMVITELGVMPSLSAPVIIRECHKDRQLS